MFQQIGQSGRAAWVDWAPAVSCIAAAAIVSVVIDDVVTAHRLPTGRALLAAALSVGGALIASAIAGRLAFSMLRPDVRARPSAVVLSFAAIGVWFGPLGFISSHAHLWSTAAFGIVAAVVAQALGRYEHALVRLDDYTAISDRPPALMFSGVDSRSTSIEMLQGSSAALFIQFAVAATSARDIGIAILSSALAGFLIGWATRKGSDERQFGASRRWKLYAYSSLVFAFAVNTMMFVSTSHRFALWPDGVEAGQLPGASADSNLHSGVVLLSEAKRCTILAPPAKKKSDFPRGEAAPPLTIPFSGEYWVFRRPMPGPPKSALVRTGSPLTYNFTDVDQSSLSMLARQVLDSPIQVACCSRIDVAVSSTDQQPTALSLELILVSSPPGSKIQPKAQSLGEARLAPITSSLGNAGNAIDQVLHFDVPHPLSIREFNEIRIVFHMEVPRGYRSANVAVDRFDLIRRGP